MDDDDDADATVIGSLGWKSGKRDQLLVCLCRFAFSVWIWDIGRADIDCERWWAL